MIDCNGSSVEWYGYNMHSEASREHKLERLLTSIVLRLRFRSEMRRIDFCLSCVNTTDRPFKRMRSINLHRSRLKRKDWESIWKVRILPGNTLQDPSAEPAYCERDSLTWKNRAACEAKQTASFQICSNPIRYVKACWGWPTLTRASDRIQCCR